MLGLWSSWPWSSWPWSGDLCLLALVFGPSSSLIWRPFLVALVWRPLPCGHGLKASSMWLWSFVRPLPWSGGPFLVALVCRPLPFAFGPLLWSGGFCLVALVFVPLPLSGGPSLWPWSAGLY